MSTTAVAPVPRWQFFTNSGAPLSGGTLTFYAAGTQNLLDTYYDPDLASNHKNQNPLTLNAAGRPQLSGTEVNVYFTAASYSIVAKDSGGTQLWESDYVPATVSGTAIPTTYAIGDLLYADSTGSLARLADVAVGRVLVSGGANTAPAWSASPTISGVLTNTGNASFGNGGLAVTASDGSCLITSSKESGPLEVHGSVTTDEVQNQLLRLNTNAAVTNTTSRFIIFLSNNAGTVMGQIRSNNSAVAYDTTSDERLKSFLGPSRYGLDAILGIDVRDYTFIADDQQRPRTGVSAQQLYGVYPEAVGIGGADPQTAPWTVDYGKLTPPLIRAVQELAARLTAVERAR